MAGTGTGPWALLHGLQAPQAGSSAPRQMPTYFLPFRAQLRESLQGRPFHCHRGLRTWPHRAQQCAACCPRLLWSGLTCQRDTVPAASSHRGTSSPLPAHSVPGLRFQMPAPSELHAAPFPASLPSLRSCGEGGPEPRRAPRAKGIRRWLPVFLSSYTNTLRMRNAAGQRKGHPASASWDFQRCLIKEQQAPCQLWWEGKRTKAPQGEANSWFELETFCLNW